MLCWVELPEVEGPSLTREDRADEPNLDYVDKLKFLAYHVPDTLMESVQLHR